MLKSNREAFKLRLGVGAGLLAFVLFIYGFFHEVGIGHRVLYGLLTFGLFLKLLKILFEWYHFAGIRRIPVPPVTPEWRVDMLTTACPEEPREMIEKTLRAMVNVRYPHETYLCDEGDDPMLKKLCQALGAHHVTRTTRENAKAGNINNALRQAKGDICVIMDPDHVPTPDFLDQVLPYFKDPEIGYVQVVQAYKNQSESLVARAAAEQTYLFYGPYMQGMSQYGTAQAIGANCTFRRKALDDIGGHAPGLTEDMHTSMLLMAKGWKSLYVPKIVSQGLVPSSLSAYYKQQLKWARGTFDLWFHVFPRIFRQLSWRQKLHYGVLPLYYFFGIICLIDFTVPMYSLLTGEYPWKVQPLLFFAYYTPLLLIFMGIRLYAQRWLNGAHEKGLHLLGGILRIGTWWVFILGFVYTLLNIKIPYIPTPKEYNPKHEFLLGLPNLVVATLSIIAVFYGLHMDWHPYSFMMAGFAGFNALLLLLAFFIGQTALVRSVRKRWRDVKTFLYFSSWQISYARFNRVAIRGMVFSSVAVLSVALPFSFINSDKLPDIEEGMISPLEKEMGGFYTGIYTPALDQTSSLQPLFLAEKEARHSFSIVSTYLAWGSDPLPVQSWKNIIQHGAIPMITWEPWTNLFPQYANHPDLSNNRKVFHYITEGYFDEYITEMALALRDLDQPVFLRFAHEMDNPMYPWSATGENTPKEFVKAWRYVHDRFEALGLHHVTWVWNPWKPTAMDQYFPSGKSYPESRYVDWVGLTCLNYGQANPDQGWYTFQDLYHPFKDKMKSMGIDLPVMLAEFGSTSYGGAATEWVSKALTDIHQDYSEIESVVLFYSDQDKNWVTSWRPQGEDKQINWTYDLKVLRPALASFNTPDLPANEKEVSTILSQESRGIEGSYGDFTWQVKGKPFYCKGICYNPEHDWRDGFLPLTRKQLEHDFQQIKEMGANTIRRYAPSIYDKNILKVAEEKELFVMYGFWFDPTIDYYKDTAAVIKYEKEVLAYVEQFKDKESIIGWNIGNETWGLLKKNFANPYLSLVRNAYLDFLERLAQKIHAIDPNRPVLASEEHEFYQLPSTLYAMRKHLPSVDVIGINSYFEPNIGSLNEMVYQFDTLRPYVVTEFGPKGYWSREFSDLMNQTYILEESSLAKAKWYEEQWEHYIQPHRGFNLGGFAFSWRDRYEGTATWYGITDYQGRLKPAYYYLKKSWKEDSQQIDHFPNIYIVGPWDKMKPGKHIWFSAGITNDYQGALNFEWEVLKKENWERVDLIQDISQDGRYIQLQAPQERSQYRLYLYATDSAGNVMTASRPMLFD